MLVPRPYQEVGRDFLAERRFALLADQMRVGKTPQAILAAAKLGVESAIVLCPAIAVPQWRAEWARWWPKGPAPEVMSYNRAVEAKDVILSKRWDVAIVDEAHFAKNPEAKRTKLVYGKGGIGWVSRRMWALSGTPAPRHAAELWPMMRAFGLVGMTYDEFVRHYCTVRPDTGKVTGTRVAKISELKKLLAPLLLRRLRREVAPDMPEVGFNRLYVTPKGTGEVQIPAGLSDRQLLGWLETRANIDAEDRQAVALAKVDPLVEEIGFAIDNGLLDQTVVFGWHVNPLEALVAKLRARGIFAAAITGKTPPKMREILQQQFRDGDIQVLACNILAAGTAIDLSSANHGYFLELDWVPGNNAQAAARLISMDKHAPVTIDVVTWRGSTDDIIQKVLLTRVEQLARMF